LNNKLEISRCKSRKTRKSRSKTSLLRKNKSKFNSKKKKNQIFNEVGRKKKLKRQNFSLPKNLKKKNVSIQKKKHQKKNIWTEQENIILNKNKLKNSSYKLTRKRVNKTQCELEKTWVQNILDTWNPNQFKTNTENILIPINRKFPIKKINFDNNCLLDISTQSNTPKQIQSNSVSSILNQNMILEKLSISNLRKDLNKDDTPHGFHQMFVSMANEFSPSWRDQLMKIMK
jgi:hypothetical protein